MPRLFVSLGEFRVGNWFEAGADGLSKDVAVECVSTDVFEVVQNCFEFMVFNPGLGSEADCGEPVCRLCRFVVGDPECSGVEQILGDVPGLTEVGQERSGATEFLSGFGQGELVLA